jgi:hypothetical protein
VRNGAVPQPGSVRCTTPAATMSNGGGRRAMLATFLVTTGLSSAPPFGQCTPTPAASARTLPNVAGTEQLIGTPRPHPIRDLLPDRDADEVA